MPLAKNTLRKLNNQEGIVSIMVTLVIIIIISLIVIGFARLTRREQRQALDRQLSTQAYYAAETAINDAVNKLESPGLVDVSVDYTTDCKSFTFAYALNGEIDGPTGPGEYTCLFVDPSPTSLEYNNIDVNDSKVIPIEAKDSGSIDTVTIYWQDKSGGTDLSGCQSNSASFSKRLPTSAWLSNCDTGVMRVDLVPVSGSITRNQLVNSSLTMFLYPSTYSAAATSDTYNSNSGFGKQGDVIRAKCQTAPISNPKQCSFTITGLGASGTKFMLRIKSIYKSSAATITASRGPTTLELKGAQALVDATGKAEDVLRRIQVRVPIGDFGLPFPEFAVQAVDTVCKNFEAAPGYYLPGPGASCDVFTP